MWQSAALHVPVDHPTAAGHFPSNPIIPGALLLDEILAAIAGSADGGAVVIRAAKFLQPVRPGQPLTLRWQSVDPRKIAFECELAGTGLAVSGRLEIGPAPP